MIKINYVKLDKNAKDPVKKLNEDAGWDIFSIEDSPLFPGATKLIRTGISFQAEWDLPEVIDSQGIYTEDQSLTNKIVTGLMNQYFIDNFEMYIQGESRSGLAIQGIHWIGGVIDSPYRGEVGVVLANTSKRSYMVKHGEKIAQVVVNIIPKTTINKVESLTESDRGSKGFGSSGKF